MDNKITNKTIQNIIVVQNLIMPIMLLDLLDIDNKLFSIVKIVLAAVAVIMAIINLRYVLLKRKPN